MRSKFTTRLALTLGVLSLAFTPCPRELVRQANKVAAVRGLSPQWRPKCELLPSALLEKRLAQKLAAELPVPPSEYLEVLQRLGFVRPTPNLYQKLLAFYTSQVLGFYEPQRDTMVVVDKPLGAEAVTAAVWAHELAHAAQEKRFRLPTRLLAVKDNSDKQRAISAIAEGEAMLVMLAVESPTPLDASQIRHTAEAIAQGTRQVAEQAGIDRFFVEDLAFPYAQGLATVLAAWEQGGWAAVDRLLARPPLCTATLLFASPCHHLDDQAMPPVPQGYVQLLADTLGAWALRFWLAQPLGEERAGAVARVWDGDRLRLVKKATEPQRWALAWQLRVQQEAALPTVREALEEALPVLFGNFERQGLPSWRLVSQGRTLTVLVNWPTPQP